MTEPEQLKAIIDSFLGGERVTHIAKRLGRGESSIRYILERARVKPSRKYGTGGYAANLTEIVSEKTYAKIMKRNDKNFQAAMTRAMRAGHETPPGVGVVVDKRPPGFTRISSGVASLSGCGSPAQAMVDMGGCDS
jgi:hypothetical protein